MTGFHPQVSCQVAWGLRLPKTQEELLNGQ